MKKNLTLFLTLLLIFPLISPALSYADHSINTAQMPQDWAINAIDALINYDVLSSDMFSNYPENITRLDFIYLAVTAYESITQTEINVPDSVTFLDTDDIYARKGATVGISSGLTQGIFGPQVLLTREQLATMIVKTIELTGEKLTPSTAKFSDDLSISSYAKAAVYKASGSKILNGNNNKVNPKGYATNQEALLIFKNIYDNFVLKDKLNVRNDLKTPNFTTIKPCNGVTYNIKWEQTYADYYLISEIDPTGKKYPVTESTNNSLKFYWTAEGMNLDGFTVGEETQFEIIAVYAGVQSNSNLSEKLIMKEATITPENLSIILKDQMKTITIGRDTLPIKLIHIPKYENSITRVEIIISLSEFEHFFALEASNPEALYEACFKIASECKIITGSEILMSVSCGDTIKTPDSFTFPVNKLLSNNIIKVDDSNTVFLYPLIFTDKKIGVNWNGKLFEDIEN